MVCNRFPFLLSAACAVGLVCLSRAASQTVLTFPVSDGATYHVRVVTRGKGGMLRLGFLSPEGRDIEPTERALGYPVTARTASVERDGETVLEARAGGKTGTTAAKGVVTLSDGDAVRVVSAQWFAGECAAADLGRTSGFDPSMTGVADFAPNLLTNPSFEEVVRGNPVGWRYLGSGEARVVGESYAGERAIKVTAAEEGGRWQSDAFAIRPGGRIEMLFAIRYSRHAEPRAHINPVNLEFLDVQGRVVPHAHRWAIDHRYYTADKFADWGMMSVNPYEVPSGAVRARVFVEHRDLEPLGGGRTTNVGWGDIVVDNIAVWQTDEAVTVPLADSNLRGAGVLLAKTKPPQLPIGRRRDGSVWAVQPLTRDFGFFFANEGSRPAVEVSFGNFLGYDRRLTLRGELQGPDGRALEKVEQTVALEPYELRTCAVPIARPATYGVYRIRFDLIEGDARAGGGSAAFAWLARRPAISAAERQSVDYPFDLHPLERLSVRASGTDERREVEARQAALIGVGGVRLQHWRTDIDLDPVKSAAQARADVVRLRTKVLPLLQRHGMRAWISYMEQFVGKFPKSEAESEGWKSYWRTFGAGISNDVEFVLFGNEGLGGYAAGYGPDDDLSRQTAFCGTIRQWTNAYRWMHAVLHEVNPTLPVGFSMAGDVDGVFTRQFYRLNPDIEREVWGINGYVRPPEMVANCLKAMGPRLAGSAFCVLPEMGYASGGDDMPARLRTSAEQLAMCYLDVKAASPQVRRLAWFIQCSSDSDAHGVFSLTYQPRPVAAAYAVMTDTLGAGRVVRTVQLPDGGRFHIWRRLDGRRIGLGVSPERMTVVATVRGALQQMDVFGNCKSVPVSNDVAVVRLGEKPSYFLGAEDLDIPERFDIVCETPDGEATGCMVASVRLVNRTTEPLALSVTADWHPALVVGEPSRSVTLAARETRTLSFPVRFVGTDGSHAYRLKITARDIHGFGVTAVTDLRFASRVATNLLPNGDFEEADEKGGAAGWTESVKFSPGRRVSEVRFAQKKGAGLAGDGCVSVSIVPPGTSDAVLRLSRRVVLKPSTRYYWSLREKSLRGSYGWPHAEAVVRDAEGRVVAMPSFDAVKLEGEWKLFEGGFVSPACPTTLDFTLLITHASRGEFLYDRAELLEVEF